jgi:lipid II:glycine glycyltransferase (peptidoglycan interpeptide bridge formation enzyme)
LDQVPEMRTKSKAFRPISKEKFQNFCQSMYEIENLRKKHADELKQSYNMEQLPSLTNDPQLLPLLDATVRNAINTFPIAASNIVHQFGLKDNEFNELLRRTRTSTFFRWKVLRNIGSIERQQSE